METSRGAPVTHSRCPACCDGPLDLHDQCSNCAWNPSIPLGGQNRNPRELAGDTERTEFTLIVLGLIVAICYVVWAVLS